jgi:hypothetical protein
MGWLAARPSDRGQQLGQGGLSAKAIWRTEAALYEVACKVFGSW